MSKQLKTQDLENLNQEDLKTINNFFTADPKKRKEFLQAYHEFDRVMRGLPPDQKEFIYALMDLNDKVERGRLPTMAIVRRQTYVRLLQKQYFGLPGNIAGSCENWMDEEIRCLIPYKSQSRNEAIDWKKAQTYAEVGLLNPSVLAGSVKSGIESQGKKHFWSRGKKQQQTEKEIIKD